MRPDGLLAGVCGTSGLSLGFCETRRLGGVAPTFLDGFFFDEETFVSVTEAPELAGGDGVKFSGGVLALLCFGVSVGRLPGGGAAGLAIGLSGVVVDGLPGDDDCESEGVASGLAGGL